MFLEITAIAARPCLLVADAYYASRKVILPLLDAGHHLIARAKINSVAWTPVPPPTKRKRGQPKKYGEKIALKKLFGSGAFTAGPKPGLRRKDVTVEYLCLDLLWRPVGRLVPFRPRKTSRAREHHPALNASHHAPARRAPLLFAALQDRIRLPAKPSTLWGLTSIISG